VILFNKPNNYYKTLYIMGCGCKKKKTQQTTSQTTKIIQQEPNSPVIVKVEEAKKSS